MKIAILTQPLHTNYGGILQAFALQSVLKKKGHDVLVVDLPFRRTKKMLYRSILTRTIKKYVLHRKNIETIVPVSPSAIERSIISENTEAFITKYIQRTETIPLVEKLDRLKTYRFEAFVVGSDQVWRPRYSPGIGAFFLDFLKDNKTIKRVAYAASFGVDYWEFTPNQTKKCKKLAQRFDAISVREDSGIALCKQFLDVDATQVPDPTLLLSKEDYTSLISSASIPSKIHSAMVYVLDNTPEKEQITQRVVQHFGLSVNSVLPNLSYSEINRSQLSECVYPPVEQWIKGFVDASFVVTDSFHGMVFAIIFNKPFVVIGNRERGMSRFTSLLHQLGLEKRLVSSPDEINDSLLTKAIDYRSINLKLESLREKALLFLTKAL